MVLVKVGNMGQSSVILFRVLCVSFFAHFPLSGMSEYLGKADWEVEVSAEQEDIYPARHLCDGDPGTRWSSPASDPQYVLIDMGRPQVVNGLTLHWETAFSSAYSVLISEDGAYWQTVYEETEGDGKTDYINFLPVNARYVKLLLTKRGTGWGHSLWEIDICTGDNRVRILDTEDASSSALFDNNSATVFPMGASQPLMVDLGEQKALGGIRIDWGPAYASEAVLYASSTTSRWTEIARVQEGTGGFDYLLGAPFDARYLKLQVEAGRSNGLVEIAGITLRGPGEFLTDFSRYQMFAQKARPGLYPEQLSGRQVYWTILGVPDDSKESLLDEYGNFEAFAGGCVLMPYLHVGGKLCSALDALSVRQTLVDGAYPMPGVVWDFEDYALHIDAFGWGRPDASGAFLRYRLENKSSTPLAAKLFLAIRPIQINPVWQHGGLSFIDAIAPFVDTRARGVSINGVPYYLTMEDPEAFGVCAFDRGDILRRLVDGELPPGTTIQNDQHLNSGALAYSLDVAPQATGDVHLAVPLSGDCDVLWRFLQAGESISDAWEKRHAEVRAMWQDRVTETTLDLPDIEIVETVKSQLAYILLNRDAAAIQPGSRHYERSWIRDGAMTSAALLRWGLHEAVREFIVWYAHFITPEGMVPPSFRHDDPLDAGPGSGIEWDGQGAYISLVMDYYRYTGDRVFLEAYFDTLVAAMKYLEILRARTLAPGYYSGQPVPERFRGILPKSFSHEGYYPEMHSYWDDFWALKGWEDGMEAARILGYTNTAHWAEQQYALLAQAVASSITATIAHKQISHIPGCAEKGDFDPTSTSIAFFPCGSARALLPAEQVHAMYDRYYAELEARKAPEWRAAFTPYEVRNIMAFVALGHYDRAHVLLDFLMDSRRPAAWNHWAEVVLGDERMGCYIGDMPHTWVGSGFLNAIALMLVKEQHHQLVLLDGVPEAWMHGEGITLKNRPTPFGTIHLRAVFDGEKTDLRISGDVDPPDGFLIKLPPALRGKKLVVNGNHVPTDSE
ncbi:MAG: hypothetical protein EOM20_15520 [Spartobacteria bacterium]|nr:hypothetical protein [Spartobacteria bacterium]